MTRHGLTTFAFGVAALSLLAGARSTRADEPLNGFVFEQPAKRYLRATIFGSCLNIPLRGCQVCPKPTDFAVACDCGTKQCQLTSSYNGSVIDNLGLNYIHFACDYRIDNDTAPSCASCGTGAVEPSATVTDVGNTMPSFKLQRIHRYRDQSFESSFGPGVFSQFDTKIFLFRAANGTNLIDVFDPSLFYTQRFADGPYTDPTTGISTADVQDGEYVSFRTNQTKEIRLYDEIGNLVIVPQDQAVRAELLTHEGLRFDFEIFERNGILVGRLTKIENRNGYAYEITYEFAGTDPLGRQWQIETISDAYARMAVFSYHPAQVSGRWVVSQITFPNDESAEYSYTAGFLSEVWLPDQTVTTISKFFDLESACNVVEIFDAAADGTHRKKRVYLQPSVRYLPTGDDQIVPQSEGLVRMVVNGDDEVAYFNYPSRILLFPLVYEGTGRLKKVDFDNGAIRATYMTDWSIALSQFGTWYPEGITTDPEPAFENFRYAGGMPEMYRNEPSRILSETGRFVDYEYNADNSTVSGAIHPDGTQELYEYNEFRQLTLYVDRINRATRYTYDDVRGNMLSKEVGLLFVGGNVVPQPEHAIWEWEYFPAGHQNPFLLAKSIDANGNETEYVYDADNFLIQISEPPDNPGGPRAERLFSYDDPAGRLWIATDAEGRETEFSYDERSRVIQIEYHDDSSEHFVYGSGADANLVVEKQDRNGNVWLYEYDGTGRMLREVEAANDPEISVETVCTFLDGTNLRQTCTIKGETTTYAYDYRHRLVDTTVQPRRGTRLTTGRTYDSNELRSTEDPYGRRTFYVYDPIDLYLIRTIRETVPGGVPAGADLRTLPRDPDPNAAYIIEDRVVDAENQLLTRVDGRRIPDTYDYDTQGRMTEQVLAFAAPEFGKTTYEYDPQGNLTRQLNPRHFAELGFISELTYTGRNLLQSRTEAVGRREAATMSYTYNLDRTIDITTDYRGNDWQTLWESCCRRVQGSVDPNGSGTISNPDFYGNIAHTAVVEDRLAVANPHDPIDPLNEVTTRYDARHRPIARTVWLVELGAVDPNDVPIARDPEDGLTTRWVYDDDLTDGQGIDATYASYMKPLRLGPGSDGYAVAMTNPENETSVTVYDGIGRVVLVIDGNGNAQRSDYDAIVTAGPGQVVETSVIDALDHVTRSRTDGAGRVIETVDEESQITRYEYDNNSNRTKVRDPNRVGEDCAYDARDRETACTDTHGDTTGKRYDAESNVTAYLDGFGRATTCIYDARNRKTSTTSRVGGVTHYTYDGNNNVLSIQDGDADPNIPGDNTTSYVYEQRNLKTEEIFAGHDDVMPGAYDKIIYAYDGARRLITRDDQNRDVTTFVYDRANRLLERRYPDRLDDVFTYDSASRLLSATSNRYANTVARTYDEASRLTSELLSVAGRDYPTGYGYDDDDRKTRITYPDGSVVRRRYTPRDQLESVKLDGVPVIDCLYDPGMRLMSTSYGNDLVETRTYRADNLIETITTTRDATGFSYTYDLNKRRTGETNTVRPQFTQTYSYDPEDRLRGWNRTDGDTQDWTLSLVGDWDGTTINGVPQPRIHNAVHELTQVDAAPLTYDPKGNLTQNANGQRYSWDFDNQLRQAVVGKATARYTYDALGRRVSKTVSGLTTAFVCDGAQVIAEYEDSALARKYSYATYIDDVCMMVDHTGSTPRRYYYHRDAIFNTRVITESAGSIVETYEYTPHGKPTIRDAGGNFIAQSSVGNPFMFQGGYHDAEAGLSHKRARYYGYELGRFLGRDPIGSWFDLSNLGNGYGYVGGNPVTRHDPLGLFPPPPPTSGLGSPWPQPGASRTPGNDVTSASSFSELVFAARSGYGTVALAGGLRTALMTHWWDTYGRSMARLTLDEDITQCTTAECRNNTLVPISGSGRGARWGSSQYRFDGGSLAGMVTHTLGFFAAGGATLKCNWRYEGHKQCTGLVFCYKGDGGVDQSEDSGMLLWCSCKYKVRFFADCTYNDVWDYVPTPGRSATYNNLAWVSAMALYITGNWSRPNVIGGFNYSEEFSGSCTFAFIW